MQPTKQVPRYGVEIQSYVFGQIAYDAGVHLGSLECFSAGFRFGSDPLGVDLSGDAPADAAGCKDTCESGPISADSKSRGRLNIYGEPFDFS